MERDAPPGVELADVVGERLGRRAPAGPLERRLPRRDVGAVLGGDRVEIPPRRDGVAAGVWIAPAPVEPEVRRVIAELGVGDHVDLFRGTHLGAAGAVAAWWDLDALAAEYRAYVAAWEPALRDGGRPAPGEAFAAHVRHLDAWRRVPFHDPGLPAAALPADWPGAHAWDVFRALARRLSRAALRHVEARVRRP